MAGLLFALGALQTITISSLTTTIQLPRLRRHARARDEHADGDLLRLRDARRRDRGHRSATTSACPRAPGGRAALVTAVAAAILAATPRALTTHRGRFRWTRHGLAYDPRPSTGGSSMRIGHLAVLALALVVTTGAPARRRAAATCMRASGNAAARCLDRYADVVARCRARARRARARRPRGPTAARSTARSDASTARIGPACTDATSAPLDYTERRRRRRARPRGLRRLRRGLARRSRSPPGPSSLSGAFLDCQREVSRQLGRLRDATVRLEGARCYLPAYRGEGCDRARRDARLAARARARARVASPARCGDGVRRARARARSTT